MLYFDEDQWDRLPWHKQLGYLEGMQQHYDREERLAALAGGVLGGGDSGGVDASVGDVPSQVAHREVAQ